MACFRAARDKLPTETHNLSTSSFTFPIALPAASPEQFSTAQRQPQPLPLPLPPPTPRKNEDRGQPSPGRLRCFSAEELAGACHNFSPDLLCRDAVPGPVYRASLQYGNAVAKVDIATVAAGGPGSPREHRAWVAELTTVSAMRHPNVCRVLGYHASSSSSASAPTMVVYEAAPRAGAGAGAGGSLETLLYARGAGVAPLDWAARVRVAAGAARGLSFLHQVGLPYWRFPFRAACVQVDAAFGARLSDYCTPSAGAGGARTDPYAAPEGGERACAKSNVWSFGVLLLELLTGRQHMDELWPERERDLVLMCKGAAAALAAEETSAAADAPPPKSKSKGLELGLGLGLRLLRVMDPELKGLFPLTDAWQVLMLALRCLRHDPRERPPMAQVAECLQRRISVSVSTSFMNASSSSSSLSLSPGHSSLPTSFSKSLSLGRRSGPLQSLRKSLSQRRANSVPEEHTQLPQT